MDIEVGAPAEVEFSLHLLYEGFPTDVERFLDGLKAGCDMSSTEVVIVDNASPDADVVEGWVGGTTRVIHLDREVGWAAARKARSTRYCPPADPLVDEALLCSSIGCCDVRVLVWRSGSPPLL